MLLYQNKLLKRTMSWCLQAFPLYNLGFTLYLLIWPGCRDGQSPDPSAVKFPGLTSLDQVRIHTWSLVKFPRVHQPGPSSWEGQSLDTNYHRLTGPDQAAERVRLQTQLQAKLPQANRVRVCSRRIWKYNSCRQIPIIISSTIIEPFDVEIST
jgi:hypothetical protein